MWTFEQNVLQRTYNTENWQHNQLLIGAIAFICEASQHHPELIVLWNRVTIRLNTHDVGGITLKDFETAHNIESHITWQPDESSSLHHGALAANGQWIR